MKLLALVLSLALLLCACTPQEPVQTDPTQNTTAPSESVSPTETEPTDPPTEPPTESNPQLLLPDAWRISNPTYLSYEEYFAQDRVYSPNMTSWLSKTDSGYVLYQVKIESGKLVVCTDATAGAYTVPCKEDLSAYSPVAADGAYAYLWKDQMETVRVDLLTGEILSLYSGNRYVTLRDGCVLYYREAEGDSIRFCRKYIPTGTVDVLYTASLEGTSGKWFGVDVPKSTQGKLSWHMINPKLLAQLNKELADPNSKYIKSEYEDRTPYWQDPSKLWEVSNMQYILSHEIQEDTGIPAFVKYTYDPATGSLAQTFGIIDTCWYGSGWQHDHFAPEITELPAPTVLLGAWTAVTPVSSRPQSPTMDEMYAEKENADGAYRAVLYSVASQPGNLFTLKNGIATPIWDKRVTSVLNSQYYIYCIAGDNTVYQLSYDGSFVQPLYTGKGTLSQLCYDRGRLFLLDGTTVIEIDVPKLQYQAVLEHPQIKHIYFSGDIGTPLRMEIYAGLCEIDYHYYPATGQLVESSPRL